VANELTQLQLEASKVHIKIKTTDFQVFTRTKSLNFFTNNSNVINESAVYLFLKEWENSKTKLKLRLFGVRVTDLRDVINGGGIEQLKQPQHIHQSITQSCNIKIDSFFQKNSKKVEKIDKDDDSTSTPSSSSTHFNEEDSLLDLKSNYYSNCPHCCEIIEGNYTFIEQHKDSCLFYID
jgi:hypothetical protein